MINDIVLITFRTESLPICILLLKAFDHRSSIVYALLIVHIAGTVLLDSAIDHLQNGLVLFRICIAKEFAVTVDVGDVRVACRACILVKHFREAELKGFICLAALHVADDDNCGLAELLVVLWLYELEKHVNISLILLQGSAEDIAHSCLLSWLQDSIYVLLN